LKKKRNKKTGSRGFDNKERKRWNQKVRGKKNNNKMKYGKEVEMI
jgi:hypothetical protein